MNKPEKIELQSGVYVGGNNSTFIVDSVSVREVDPVTGELGPELIEQIVPIDKHMFWGPELITPENRGKFVVSDDFDWPERINNE